MKHFAEEDEEDLGALFHESGNVRDMEQPQARPGDNRGIPEDDALDDMDMEDLLKEGRQLLIKDLIRAVKGGYASPAEKNTLRQILRDNGMIMGGLDEPTQGGGTAQKQKAPLPSFEEPDYSRR